MNVLRTSFPGISPAVKTALAEGRALLMRVRRGDTATERFLLRVGNEEVFLNADGHRVERVPVRVEQLVADDVVTFVP